MIQQLFADLAHFRSEMLMSRYNKARVTGDKIIKMIDCLGEVGLDKQEIEKLRNQILIELKLCSEIQKMINEDKNSDLLSFRRRSRDRQSAGSSTKKSLSSGRRQFRSREIKTTKKSPQHKITQYVASSQEKNTQNIGKWGRSKRTKSQASDNLANTQGSLQMTNSAKFQFTQHSNQEKQFSPEKKQIQAIKEEQESEQMCRMGRDQMQIIERDLILPINMPEFFKNTEAKRFIICYYKKCADLLKKIDREIKIKQVVEMDFLSQFQTIKKKQTTSKNGYTVYVSPFTTTDKQIIIKIFEQPLSIIVLYAEANRIILTEKPSVIRHPDYNIQF